MLKVDFKTRNIYVLEVFIYSILLTYSGLLLTTILDKLMIKINNKIKDDDKFKKHIITFLHIGLIGVLCLVIREIIVYIENSIVGYTWGDPSKYATIIMGSIMFSNSTSLHKNVKLILGYYNLK